MSSKGVWIMGMGHGVWIASGPGVWIGTLHFELQPYMIIYICVCMYCKCVSDKDGVSSTMQNMFSPLLAAELLQTIRDCTSASRCLIRFRSWFQLEIVGDVRLIINHNNHTTTYDDIAGEQLRLVNVL